MTFADYLERRQAADLDVRKFVEAGDIEVLRRRSWADLIRAMKAAGADETYIKDAATLHRDYARASGRVFRQQLARGEGPAPREEDVGARIRVKAERANAASALLISKGLTPLYIEPEEDGAMSFWFGKLSLDDLSRAASSLPREWHATDAIAP